jgi:acetoin utilization protein AcuB
MTSPAITIGWDEPLSRAWTVMREARIRHLPAIDVDGRLVGMLTDGDIREALEAERVSVPAHSPSTLIVGKAMTWDPVTVVPSCGLGHAARLMVERTLSALPVVEAERVVGILTETDILRAFAELLDA